MNESAPSMTPTGWFQVAWSAELQPGDVKNLHYLGRGLVGFRTEGGRAVVLDAHCAHLGAHLGHGGSVQGEHIICPFHGWEWDGDGRNVLIPYQDHTNRARCIRSWAVSEKNEAIFIWHDGRGRPPLYPVPDAFTELFAKSASPDDYYTAYPATTVRLERVAVHPQTVMENSVDVAHFKFVHHANEIPRFVDMQSEEWVFHTTFEMTVGGGKAATMLTPDGPVECGLDTATCGISLGFIRQFGPDNQRTMVNATPVDDEVSDLFFTNWLERTPGDGPDLPESMQRRQKLVVNQFKADVRIWEHLRYTDPAGLATSEVRGFVALRRWAQRFYPMENKEIATAFVRAWIDGDPDRAMALLADDARIWFPGDYSPACGWHTKASHRELEERIMHAFPKGMTMALGTPVAEGDRVALEGASEAELDDGRRYRNTYHFLFTIREGLIRELKEYCDTHHVWKTLVDGRPPPPPECRGRTSR